jgi:xanthine dehydrogenase/oxidase
LFYLVSGPSTEGEHEPLAPSDFINVSMRRKVIGKLIFPSLNSDNFVFKSYKIMSRAENAQSIVNGAFLVEFNSNNREKVLSTKICFGGISSEFIHAEKLETFLKDKNLFTNEILQESIKILKDELKPDIIGDLPSPKDRQRIAISLFYKFILNISPKSIIKSQFQSGGNILTRGLSTAKQVIDVNEGKSKLFKRIPKVEGESQCSGESQYVNDIPKQHNELHAAFVLGDKVNGKIVNIDVDEALKIPGVYAFYSAKDIPGINNFMPLKFTFHHFKVEEVFCSEKILYHGQPIGMILADSFDLAYKARDLVKVEYVFEQNDEPVYPTLAHVTRAKASERLYDVPEYNLKAKEYGKNVKQSLKGHFEIPSTQYHYHLETQQCLCIPNDGELDVYSSSQWSDGVQCAISEVLNMPTNLINCYVKRVGGAFGGKITRQMQIAAAAALGSHLSKRPVRLVMTMEDNMRAIGKRFSSMSDYVADVDDNGKIQKLYHKYIHDQGCGPNELVQFNTSVYIKNCYDIKSWDVETQSAITNSPSNTWMR